MVFQAVMPFSLLMDANISEEHTATTFRVLVQRIRCVRVCVISKGHKKTSHSDSGKGVVLLTLILK